MPALFATLLIFSFQYSLLFFHVGSPTAAAAYVVYPISDIAFVYMPFSAEYLNKYVTGDWHLSTHADTTSTRRAIFHEQRISSVTVTSRISTLVYSRVCVARALAVSSDFELLEEQSSQKLEIPSQGCRWTAVQNLTPQALSSAEKSVTVQTNE